MATRKSTRARTLTRALQDENIVADILPGLRANLSSRRATLPARIDPDGSDASNAGKKKRLQQSGRPRNTSLTAVAAPEPEKFRPLGTTVQPKTRAPNVGTTAATVGCKNQRSPAGEVVATTDAGPIDSTSPRTEFIAGSSVTVKRPSRIAPQRRRKSRKNLLMSKRKRAADHRKANNSEDEWIPDEASSPPSAPLSSPRPERVIKATRPGLRKPTAVEQNQRYARVTENIKKSRPSAFPSLPVGIEVDETSFATPDNLVGPHDKANKGAEPADQNEDSLDSLPDVKTDFARLEKLFRDRGLNWYWSPEEQVEVESEPEPGAATSFIDFCEDDISLHPSINGWVDEPAASRHKVRAYPADLVEKAGLPCFTKLDIRLQIEMIQTMMHIGHWGFPHFAIAFKLREDDLKRIVAQMAVIDYHETRLNAVPGITHLRFKAAGNRKGWSEIYDEELAKARRDPYMAEIESNKVSLDNDSHEMDMNIRKPAIEFVKAWKLNARYLGRICPGEGEEEDLCVYRAAFINDWRDFRSEVEERNYATGSKPSGNPNLPVEKSSESAPAAIPRKRGRPRKHPIKTIPGQVRPASANTPDPSASPTSQAQRDTDNAVAPRYLSGLFTPSASPVDADIPIAEITNDDGPE